MNDFFMKASSTRSPTPAAGTPLPCGWMALLKDKPRHRNLLETVGAMSGGWKRGPCEVNGRRRARGVSMASPFGSETAAIAEVSVRDGETQVHNVWVALDPGSIVNPAIVTSQVESAVALGLSATLFEGWSTRTGAAGRTISTTVPSRRAARCPRACPDRGERHPDGRCRRTQPARRAAGGGERGGGSDQPTHPQPSAGEKPDRGLRLVRRRECLETWFS